MVFGSTLLDYRGDRKQPPEVTSADYKISQNQVGNILRIAKAALLQDIMLSLNLTTVLLEI